MPDHIPESPFDLDAPPPERPAQRSEVDVEGLTPSQKVARVAELRQHAHENTLSFMEREELTLLADGDFGDPGSLREWKLDPPQPLQARIEHLSIIGMNTILFGVYKSGKSTLEGNLPDSLLDGKPYLGQFETVPLDGSLIVIDWEDDQSMLYERYTRRPLKNDDRLFVRSLRDTGCTPMVDDCAEFIVEYIRRHEGEAVLFNTVSSSIAGDPNKFKVANEYLARLGEIKVKSGAKEIWLGAHTAHTATRGEHGIPIAQHIFGSSQFSNWKDSGLSLTMDNSGRRYLDPTTRLMEPKTPRFALDLDHDSQLVRADLSATPVAGRGSRGGRTKDEVKADLVTLLTNATKRGEELPKDAIEKGVVGDNNLKRTVLDKLIDKGKVSVRIGPHGSRLHSWIG
jgi:hypothetical protein